MIRDKTMKTKEQKQYEALEKLQARLEEEPTSEFIHPRLGIVKVQTERAQRIELEIENLNRKGVFLYRDGERI